MPVLIDTSTIVSPTAYGNQRKVDRCQNGVLWTCFWNGSDANGSIEFWYSTDDGATWTQGVTSSFNWANASLSHAPNISFFVDLDDFAHVAYKDIWNGQIYYRRGTPNAARTTWTWSAATQVSEGSNPTFPDIVACRTPGSSPTEWDVFIVASYSNNCVAYYERLHINNAGTVTNNNFDGLPLHAGMSLLGSHVSTGESYPSIDFNHTGDGKTVAGGTPHLYVGWSAAGIHPSLGIRFRKATYSAGAWNWGTDQAIDSGHFTQGPHSWLNCLFDGTRVILVGFGQNASNNFGAYLHERDAADTVTINRTLLTNLATPSPEALLYGSATYDSSDNVYLSGMNTDEGTGQKDLVYRKWDRATETLGNEVVIDSTTGHASGGPWLTFKRGDSHGRIEWVYTDGTASPFSIKYDSIILKPITPTNLIPANGATVNTDIPTIGLTLTATGTMLQRGQWDIASDSGFTTNLRTITEPTGDNRVSGATTEVVPIVDQLSQATWYIRGRTVNEVGLFSDWTPTNTFTVAHTPSTIGHSPTGGVYRAFGILGETTLSWTFSDTSSVDNQTAYELTVERNSDGVVLVSTGKVISSSQTYVATIPAADKDIDLRWRIRVWDSDDVVGSYSSYHLFKIGDVPVVNVTAPIEGSTVNTPTPTIEWTNTITGGRTAAEKRIRFFRNLDSLLAHNSGWIANSIANYTPSTADLVNNEDYRVEVEVKDTGGLVGFDTNLFSTSWVLPASALPDINLFFFEQDGFVRITWDNLNQDPDFSSWRVYRRVAGSTAWTRIYDGLNLIHDDYTAQAQTSYEYAVVQVALRFGVLVESAYNPVAATTGGIHYWLIDESDPALSIKLYHITADNFVDEHEEQQITLLGRGRHYDFGENWGVAGSLTCELRDQPGVSPREQRLRIETWKNSHKALHLKTPFGDYWNVVASNISFNRTPGVGVSEYGSLTIPYFEVHDG